MSINEWWKKFSIEHLGAVDWEARDRELEELREQSRRDMEYVNWFENGGVCPRCGSIESTVDPKPSQCDKCGIWFNIHHRRRTCSSCNLILEKKFLHRMDDDWYDSCETSGSAGKVL